MRIYTDTDTALAHPSFSHQLIYCFYEFAKIIIKYDEVTHGFLLVWKVLRRLK